MTRHLVQSIAAAAGCYYGATRPSSAVPLANNRGQLYCCAQSKTGRSSAGPGPRMSANGEGHKYIIIGGGTAGCVLANRLSADKDNAILVLEAGSPKFEDRNIKQPLGIRRLARSVFDWGFQSSDEKFVTSEGIDLCCGKVLGGSSCTDAMLYDRGQKSDYDAWGVDGWTGEDVLPYFNRAENNRSKKKGRFHGRGGPWEVENARYTNPLTNVFFKACEQAGMSPNDDFNDWSRPQDGYGRFQVSQKNGRRCSTASSYLKQAIGRKNLDVQTRAHITKVLIENGAATGVEYVQEGEKRIAKLAVGGEVLLSAGAVNSPQVLMLSGVGPAEHLESKNIKVRSNLPGVGRNLRGQPAVTMMADIKNPVSVSDMALQKRTGDVKKLVVLRWLLTGTGPLVSPVCEQGAFYKTSSDKEVADVQFRYAPARSTTSDAVKGYTEASGGSPRSGMTLQVVVVRAKSEGLVQLRSSDPFHKPHIITNYFQDRDDVESLTKGLGVARKLFGQPAFEDIIGKEIFPGAHVTEFTDYIKSTVHSTNSLAGTCKMGSASDDMAVVDSDLKVKGVAGLRVIDASVMPCIPGGQTGVATVTIAEKAADMLRLRSAA